VQQGARQWTVARTPRNRIILEVCASLWLRLFVGMTGSERITTFASGHTFAQRMKLALASQSVLLLVHTYEAPSPAKWRASRLCSTLGQSARHQPVISVEHLHQGRHRRDLGFA